MTRMRSSRPLLALLAGLLVLAGAGPAPADQMADGRVAWADGEYEDALVLLIPLAERGDMDAQYLVGNMLSCGYGAPIDLARGFGWYTAAAEQGHPDAEYAVAQEWALARASDVPDPIPEDYAQSYFWFSIAASSYQALHKGEQYEKALEMRDRMARRLTPAEKAEADQAVSAWHPASKSPPSPQLSD